MSQQDKMFKKAISLVNTNTETRFPAMQLARDNPDLAAVISKLTTPITAPMYNNDGNRDHLMPSTAAFKTAAETTAQNINDAQTVMQILPDMELAAQILVSSIISPKDMMTTELTYTIAEGLMAPDISAAMIARTRLYFEQDHKIEPLLPKILRDILFDKGSFAMAVIPENSIDEVINNQSNRVSMESLSEVINPDGTVRSLGLLGPAVKATPTIERTSSGVSLESLQPYHYDKTNRGVVSLEGIINKEGANDTFLTVTDNPSVLKIPLINQKIREQRILNAVGSRAMESFTNPANRLTDREMSGLVYKNRQFGYKPVTSLKTQEQLRRHTVGNPLILHLPSESVIPVYVPGTVEQQVGFFVLLDADGNPISKASNPDYYRDLSGRMSANGQFPSAMLNKVKSMMSGFDLNDRRHLDYSARVYGDMIEQDLLARGRSCRARQRHCLGQEGRDLSLDVIQSPVQATNANVVRSSGIDDVLCFPLQRQWHWQVLIG